MSSTTARYIRREFIECVHTLLHITHTSFTQDLLNFLKLCFKKNPVERPTAQHLLHHPWVQHTIPSTGPIEPVRSNSTILNNYLKRTTKIDDKIILESHDPLPTFQPSTKLSSKLVPKKSLMTRQSMPIVSNQYQHKPHEHNLIEGSFPKGAGQCKVCHNHIKNDALVCKGKPNLTKTRPNHANG